MMIVRRYFLTWFARLSAFVVAPPSLGGDNYYANH